MDSKEEAGWPMIRHVAEPFLFLFFLFFLPFFVTLVQVVSLLSIRSFEVSI